MILERQGTHCGGNRFMDQTRRDARFELAAPVLSCKEVRQLDLDAVERYGMPSLILMENAGRSLVDALEAFLSSGSDKLTTSENANPFHGKRFLILCGKGNNGGDGFVVARRLVLLGASVHVLTTVPDLQYSGDAAVNLAVLTKLATSDVLASRLSTQTSSLSSLAKLVTPAAGRLTICTLHDDLLDEFVSIKPEENDFDWIIDALLGTGATGALRPPYDRLVQWVNESGKPVFAVDLPSGFDAESGRSAGQTVRATLTCTLAAFKPGLLLPEAAPFVGKLVCGDIGMPIYG